MISARMGVLNLTPWPYSLALHIRLVVLPQRMDGSQRIDDRIARDAFVPGNRAKDGSERPKPEWMMVGNDDPLVRWCFGLQNDMTANLMHSLVLPSATENLSKACTGQVPRNPHATDKTSSRTKWRRMRSGVGWS